MTRNNKNCEIVQIGFGSMSMNVQQQSVTLAKQKVQSSRGRCDLVERRLDELAFVRVQMAGLEKQNG